MRAVMRALLAVYILVNSSPVWACTQFLQAEAHLVHMLPQYHGEDRGEYVDAKGNKWGVTYYEEDEILNYEVKIKDGKLVGRYGRMYETDYSEEYGEHEQALFIIDRNHRLIVSDDSVVGSIHHSSFTRGEPVVFSGKIIVEDGVVTNISDESGHYRVRVRNILYALRYLRGAGLDVSQLTLNGYFAREEFNKYGLNLEETADFIENYDPDAEFNRLFGSDTL